MSWIIDWLSARLLDAWLHEMSAWEVRQLEYVRGAPPYFYCVTDEKRHSFKVLPATEPVPNYEIQRFRFDSQDQADAFVDHVCARAAVIHLLCFWRPSPYANGRKEE